MNRPNLNAVRLCLYFFTGRCPEIDQPRLIGAEELGSNPGLLHQCV